MNDPTQPMWIDEPEELPRGLVDPLRDLFRRHPDVSAAYLATISAETEGTFLLVGIEAEQGSQVEAEAAGIARSVYGDNARAILLGDDPVSHYVRSEVEPFYGSSAVTAIDADRLARIDANPPKWGDSFLGRLLGNAESHTQIAISAVVQANMVLWQPTDQSVPAPAVIVYSASPERRLDRRWVRRLARRLQSLRETDGLDPTEQRLRDRLDAEDDWFFEQIPPNFSNDPATFWGVVAMSHSELPGGCLPADGLLPVLTRSAQAKKPGELLDTLAKADWARAELR